MKCDCCGKEMNCKDNIVDDILGFEPAMVLQILECKESQSTLGKYWGTKVNVNGILTWSFCFECVLDRFLGGRSK